LGTSFGTFLYRRDKEAGYGNWRYSILPLFWGLGITVFIF